MSKQTRNDELRDPRWSDVMSRSPAADGHFVYAVSTTGVYCRPSCGSRHAKYENVRFFDSVDEAEVEGFRPCRRCEPKGASRAERHQQLVIELCRFIERNETPPTLTRLAQQIGCSPSHTRRIFQNITGLTPKTYVASQLRRRVQESLNSHMSITAAIFSAGYGSTSRFYEKSEKLLGMTASEFRAGAKDQTIRFAVGFCSLDHVLVAATDKGVCAVLFGDEPDDLIDDLVARFPKADLVGADSSFEDTVSKVIAVVESPGPTDLPLDVKGTVFQQRVWQALGKIPPGHTATYSEIAKAIGSPQSARAVASACAANPVGVLIPCHRVVRIGGELSGYRWGVDRKRKLLAHEAKSVIALRKL